MNAAIILSGGVGARLNSDRPKQYIKINDEMIITYCLETFINSSDIDIVWIVAAEEYRQAIIKELDDIFSEKENKVKGFSNPGQTRQLSIYNALIDLKDILSDQDNVIIHDAARPFVSMQTINQCLKTLEDWDGAMPALPMKDTVYLCDESGQAKELLPRESVCAGQAPEAFKYGKYFQANENLMPDKIYTIKGSTEPALLAGLKIKTIPGDEGNFKITTDKDLDRAKQVIAIGEY